MDITQEIKILLSTPKKIVITTHINPDGDAVGSSLGLYHYLRQLGHEVVFIAPSDYGSHLTWMQGNDQVINYEAEGKRSRELVKEAEVIFCLDFNHLSRIEELGHFVNKSEAVKVMIDHHPSPQDFADFTISDTSASSTAELIYDLIVDMGDEEKINLPVAEALYTGAMTDTGCFQFSSTTARSHQMVAALLEKGIRHYEIYDAVFNNASENKLRFFGFCMHEKMKVYPEHQAAIIYVSEPEQQRFKIQKGDTEGLVNIPLQMAGIKMSAFMRSHNGLIKISFRSKGDMDVNTFARKYFEGGGHKNAAGGKSSLSLEKTVEKFESAWPEYFNMDNKHSTSHQIKKSVS